MEISYAVLYTFMEYYHVLFYINLPKTSKYFMQEENRISSLNKLSNKA